MCKNMTTPSWCRWWTMSLLSTLLIALSFNYILKHQIFLKTDVFFNTQIIIFVNIIITMLPNICVCSQYDKNSQNKIRHKWRCKQGENWDEKIAKAAKSVTRDFCLFSNENIAKKEKKTFEDSRSKRGVYVVNATKVNEWWL